MRHSTYKLAAAGLACAVLSTAGGLAAGCRSPETADTQEPSARAQSPQTAESRPGGDDSPRDRSTSDDSTSTREAVLGLLSGYEDTPTKRQLDHQGEPEAVAAALIDIYRDDAVAHVKRTRALSALRFYPDERSREVFEAVLEDAATPQMDRRLAIKAYGTAFGDEAIPVVAGFLDHDDYHTRDAAVRTLARLDSARARDALRARLDDEPAAAIRKRIEKALPARGEGPAEQK